MYLVVSTCFVVNVYLLMPAHNLTILYIAPPEIVLGPNQKTVMVGEQLKLTCEAIGIPKPSITWAKDDISLEVHDRIQVLLEQCNTFCFYYFMIHYNLEVKTD